MGEEELLPHVQDWLERVVAEWLQTQATSARASPWQWLAAHMRSRYAALLGKRAVALSPAEELQLDSSAAPAGSTASAASDDVTHKRVRRIGELLATLPAGVAAITVLTYVEEVLELVARVLAPADADAADTLLRLVGRSFLPQRCE